MHWQGHYWGLHLLWWISGIVTIGLLLTLLWRRDPRAPRP